MLRGLPVRTKLLEAARDLWCRVTPFVGLQLLVVVVFLLITQWRLIENVTGCVVWANYTLPCTQVQYLTWVQWNPPLGVWRPLAGMGGLPTLPFSTTLEGATYWYPAAGLSDLIGPSEAAAWYAVLSVLFLAAAFLLWSGTVIRRRAGRFAALLLIIAGPFQLQLYGNGDYALFVAEAFTLLSIYLLYHAIHEVRRRWLFYPASFACLIVSFAQVQIFLLGFILYAAFLVLYVVPLGEGPFAARLKILGGLALRFLALPLLLCPLILPALFSPPFGLGPASSYANPLLIFRHFSATPQSVFFMLGYLWTPGTALTDYTGYAMVMSASNSTLADIWTVLTIVLLLSVWGGILLFRDRRGIAMLALALLAALFGSGTQGPLGPLNTYLYLHLAGYQEINASYFWDWMIVVPATALALGVLVERISEASALGQPSTSAPRHEAVPRGIAEALRSFLRHRPTLRPVTLRALALGLALLLLTTIVLPYTIGSQNGPVQGGTVGIQTVAYPNDYASIPGSLTHLVGSSYAGVAVFNPTRAWYLYNSSSVVPNYFYYFPTVRSPIIPSYNTAPVASGFYSYWAYEALYSNSSTYVGQLLALSGIGYLLVFYGTQPIPSYLFASYAGTNVTRVLEYQHGITRVVSSKDFAIYKDLYFTSAAASLSSFSLVAGGYSELDAMAYAGLNLSQQGVVFASDLPEGACTRYLERTSAVYTASANALEGLALACSARSTSDPVDFLSGDHTVNDGWVSSFSSEGGALGETIVEAWPSPLAVTFGRGHATSVPVTIGTCRSCRLWVLVRFAPGDGELRFDWAGSAWSVNTTQTWSGTNNSMIWVQLPFQPGPGQGALVFTSLSGWNAVGPVYVAAPETVSSWLANLSATKPVVLTQPGATLAPPNATAPGQSWYYCTLQTIESFERSSLCFQAMGSQSVDFNLTLLRGQVGTLSLLIRSTSYADLEVTSSSRPLFGFQTDDSKLSTFRMGWVRVPSGPGELSSTGNLSLRLVSGGEYLSEVIFTPDSFYGPLVPAPGGPLLTSPVIGRTPLVSGFNFTLASGGGSAQELAGNIHFQSPGNNYYLGRVTLSRTSLVRYDVAITYDVSPGLTITLDGVPMGGNGTAGPTQVNSSMYTITLGSSWTSSSLQFFTAGATAETSVNATYTITVQYGVLPVHSNLSNMERSGAWTIQPDSNGYRLSGDAASLILVRVPYYPVLTVGTSGYAIAPAFGSVDSLIIGSGNVTELTISTTVERYLLLGYEILGLTMAVWIATEYLWLRRQATQRSRKAGSKPRTSEETDPGRSP